MNIGFDFDGVLSGHENFEKFISLIDFNSHNCFILTSRNNISEEIIDKVNQLNLNISEDNMHAIGSIIGEIDTKANFIKTNNIPCDIFFDDDPYEVEAFREAGIQCLWVANIMKDSFMWEITEGFFRDKCH